VQFPVKFEMVVNLKTAKALGLAVPSSIMLRATEVVEQRRLFGAPPLRSAIGPSRRFRPSTHFRCWRKPMWQRTSRNRTE
jgi:hypothetical protein